MSASNSRPRLHLGHAAIDVLTFAEALDAIEALVDARQGGAVFTPNVDHLVKLESDAAFRQAYSEASLSLVDGMPLVWASRLLGVPLPEKISGSDLILPLMERAAARRWRIFLTGAGPGVAEKAATRLQREHSVNICGVDSPRIAQTPGQGDEAAAAVERVARAQADLVLVAFGAPKQEKWIHQNAQALRPAVAVAVGAGLDFIAGTVQRAPRWVSRAGIEWLYRMGQEPRRLWRRYLLEDPKFLLILLRALKMPRRELLIASRRLQREEAACGMGRNE